MLSKIKKWSIKAWDHKLTLFVYLASIYLIFYTFYFFNKDLKIYIDSRGYEELIKYLSQVSILIFTSGIFAASLKYLQLLEVFKNQFNEYIESSTFDNKLKKNLKSITFSEDYLLEQSDLPALWKKITLSMYKKEFPHIYEKINKKLNNTFFDKDNISYYYQNFQMTFEISLEENDIVKTIQRINYTIIRPNTNSFIWDFKFSIPKSEIDANFVATARLQEDINNFTDIERNLEDIGSNLIIKFSKKLKDKLEYHLEREVTTYQKISEDRIFSFGCDRIINLLNVDIKHSKNMNVLFQPVNRERFDPNNCTIGYDKSYTNRDILLPGEKFILIYLKKNSKK